MKVKIYNTEEEEPCLRLHDVLTEVTRLERSVNSNTGVEEMIIFANGLKREYFTDGLAFVLFADDADPQEWQLKKGEAK